MCSHRKKKKRILKSDAQLVNTQEGNKLYNLWDLFSARQKSLSSFLAEVIYSLPVLYRLICNFTEAGPSRIRQPVEPVLFSNFKLCKNHMIQCRF